jgi:ribonuclease HI
MGETLSFAPRKAIKFQFLADFLAEWTDTQLPITPIQPKLWTMYFDGSLMKTGAGAGLLFVSPLGKHLCYVVCLHFPASNNVTEYEALVNRLRIVIELGVRRLDARGDSQLVIDQVMKNSHCRDWRMEAYCDEIRRLEDKFYGLELNHIARRYNETTYELAKIASGRTMVPRTSSPETYINHLSRSTTRPSLRKPRPSPRYPRPSRKRPCPSRRNRMGSRRIRTGRPRTWNISSEESFPSTKTKARRLARRAKSFVLLGDEKELYHRSPSGILQRCISIAQGQELLQEIHSGACGHHAAPRALVGNAF